MLEELLNSMGRIQADELITFEILLWSFDFIFYRQLKENFKKK
jgi:hypothetical protein